MIIVCLLDELVYGYDRYIVIDAEIYSMIINFKPVNI